jgi:hypothetical protein
VAQLSTLGSTTLGSNTTQENNMTFVLEALKCGTLGLAAIVAYYSYRYLMHHQTMCIENLKAFTSVLYFSISIVIIMVVAEGYSRTLDFIKDSDVERAKAFEIEHQQLIGLQSKSERQRQTLEMLRTEIMTACGQFSMKPGTSNMDSCPNPSMVCDLVHGMRDSIDDELKKEDISSK